MIPISDYGLSFGFRNSGETKRIANGRLRTPATGPTLLLGTLVEQDPATPGFLRVAAANANPRPGTCGLLLQEEVWDRTIYQSEQIDSFEMAKALPNRLSVITNGAGVKVWFKNTAASSRVDGRNIPAVTMFNANGVAVGRGLAWNGTTYVDVADPLAATSIGEVTEVGTGYVEVLLNK